MKGLILKDLLNLKSTFKMLGVMMLFFAVVFLAVVWVCFFFAVPEAEVFFFVFPLPFVVFAMQNFSPFSYYSRKYPAMELKTSKGYLRKIFLPDYYKPRFNKKLYKMQSDFVKKTGHASDQLKSNCPTIMP